MLHLIGTIYIEGLIVYYVPKTLPPPPKLHMKIVPPLVITIKCSPSLPPPPPQGARRGRKVSATKAPQTWGSLEKCSPRNFFKNLGSRKMPSPAFSAGPS